MRLVYPSVDGPTREVIGVNTFLDALPVRASEIKLHMIRGGPMTFRKVDAVMEAENKKTARR